MARTLTIDDVTWQLRCMPEDTEVRGNAVASGDNAFDKETEDRIIGDLESGNQWAWCCVKLTGCWHGIGVDTFLGCCSYDDEAAFKAGGYYEDMQGEVLAVLQQHDAAP